MNSKNVALENSLQCLRHPLTIASIVLLVLNDHVFKVIVPSTLTGKLSDFAGLFFFPFLVAAILSLARFEISTGKIGATAIGVTGLGFFLLKTTPLINSVSAQAASTILGRPVAYVLDPTDALALMMLLPAWWLWSKPKDSAPSRLSWGFLVAAALASLATSPAVPPVQADKVVYQDNVLYVIDLNTHRSETSKDFGNLWENSSYDLPPNSDFEKSYPAQACHPEKLHVCYRTPGNGTVEMTSDGVSWQAVWDLDLPAGRLGVIERIKKEKVNLGPYDLLIAQKNNQTALFVALGKIGLLKHSLPDGDWMLVREPFLYTDFEDSYVEEDFVKANAILGPDWIRWESVSILTLLAVAGWLRRKYTVKTLSADKQELSFIALLLVLFSYVILAMIMTILATSLYGAFSFMSIFENSGPFWAFILNYLIPVIWLLVYIRKLSSHVMVPSDVGKTILVSVVAALSVLFFGIMPIVFWVQGKIEQDIQVVLWTMPPIICIIVGWFFFLYRRTYRAPEQE